jgi:hypothetical protein
MLDILIMSCDSYDDCWEPFSILYNKYFPNNYKTYIVTETKTCPYFDTIKKTGAWTKRLREALQELDSEYVLLMLEDYFIHSKVDIKRIEQCLNDIKLTNAIVYNFEFKYRQGVELNNRYDIQLNNQHYLNSTQPSIWNRQRLIERLDKEQTAQEWELTKIDSEYIHLINNTNEKIIDIGYDLTRKPWGIVKGKWSRETKELFDKEGIQVDYEKRGYFN